MKICFISPGAAALFFPETAGVTHGGAEAQFYMLARELARLAQSGEFDFDVHALVEGDGDAPASRVEGVTVHTLPFRAGVMAKWRLQKRLRAIGADVYLQRGVGSLTKEVAFHCLWERRAKFVYWIANDIDVDPEIDPMELDRNRWFVWGMRRADLIVAQTRRQAEALRRHHGREAVVIANGFPGFGDDARNDRSDGTDTASKDERGRVILWVGRFVPFKRPERFVELARRLPNECFAMIAPIAESAARDHYARHRAIIASTPNLEFIPGSPLSETDAWFARARLLVNTSEFEGFPNTFIQAMRVGAPLASWKVDPDDMIATNDLGVAPSAPVGDFDAFVDALEELLGDPERLAHCSANARAHGALHHNLTPNATLLAKTLEREFSDRR